MKSTPSTLAQTRELRPEPKTSPISRAQSVPVRRREGSWELVQKGRKAAALSEERVEVSEGLKRHRCPSTEATASSCSRGEGGGDKKRSPMAIPWWNTVELPQLSGSRSSSQLPKNTSLQCSARVTSEPTAPDLCDSGCRKLGPLPGLFVGSFFRS